MSNNEETKKQTKDQAVAPESTAAGEKEQPTPTETDSKFAELEIAHQELKDELLRARADCDNLYKRMQREIIRMQNQGIKSFGFDLCDVLDQLHLARTKLETQQDQLVNKDILAGVTLVQKELLRVFKKHGIEKLEVIGKKFDPEVSEAVATVKTNKVASGHVVEELRKGYIINDSLLRAARVVVAVEQEKA